ACRQSSPAHAAPTSSPFSAVDLLHHVDLEIALGNELLELGVLSFELAKAFDISRIQLPESLAPGVDGLLADFMLLGNLGDRTAIGFTQDRDHLFFAKAALLHRLPF